MFKLTLFLGLAMLVASMNVRNDIQNTRVKVDLKNANVVVYEMNYMNTVYTYEVGIKRDDSVGVILDWKLKNPGEKVGKITITNNAFQNATQLQTNFLSGDKVYDKAVTVLLSNRLFSDFSTKNAASIFTGAGEATPVKFIKGDNSYTLCKVNGVSEKLFTCNATGFKNGKEVKISYWDNAEFPVILNSEQGYSLKLVEIRTE